MKVLEVSSLDELRVKIKAERKRQGLTQQQISDKAYVAKRTVSTAETGKFVPQTAVLIDIIRALGYDELRFKLRSDDENI